MKKIICISFILFFLVSILGTIYAFQKVYPNEIDLEIKKEAIIEIFNETGNRFLATHEVWLYTEADCDDIHWTLGGQTHSYSLFCGRTIGFEGVPSGTYYTVIEGCGSISSGNLTVYEDLNLVICPSDLDITDCCPEGVLIGGGYFCDDECPEPVSTTTTTMQPTTTSTSSTTTSVLPTFLISGHVTGDVFIIASITLSGKVNQETETDNTGYYEFSDLESGYYVITPEKEGCSFGPPYYVVPNLTSDLYNMDFVYTQMPPAPPCTAEVIYGGDSEEVEILRYFRDEILSQSPEGQEIIRLYYQWSPAIVEAMEGDEEFKEDVKEMIDGVLVLITEETE